MNLKAWRHREGLSRAECGRRIGVADRANPSRAWSRIENGEVNCDADTVRRIADVTGLAMGEVRAALDAARLAFLERRDGAPGEARGATEPGRFSSSLGGRDWPPSATRCPAPADGGPFSSSDPPSAD